MNDRHLYKAKRLDNGEWVDGYYLYDGVTGKLYIHAIRNCLNESEKVGEEGCLKFVAFEIDPSTLCHCTGLKDKNDRLIWENDIIRFTLSGELGIFEYREDIAAFTVCNLEKTRTSFVADWKDKTEVEVIGNIFDNPELLEVGE